MEGNKQKNIQKYIYMYRKEVRICFSLFFRILSTSWQHKNTIFALYKTFQITKKKK